MTPALASMRRKTTVCLAAREKTETQISLARKSPPVTILSEIIGKYRTIPQALPVVRVAGREARKTLVFLHN